MGTLNKNNIEEKNIHNVSKHIALSWIREFMWVNLASLAEMIDRKYEAIVSEKSK